MNDLQIFQNEEFGQVRSIIIDGEPWFVGKDVAEALQYKEPQKAIRTHVDNADKGVSKIDTPGGRQNLIIINESGVYSLIFSSKLPSAKKFKRWVTSEVLPALRKTGSYSMNKTSTINLDNNLIENLATIASCDDERFSYIAWILDGMRFQTPGPQKESTNTISDDFMYVKEFTNGTDVINRPTNDVYNDYVEYCDLYNIKAVSNIVFSKLINRALGTHVKQKKLNNVNRKIFTY